MAGAVMGQAEHRKLKPDPVTEAILVEAEEHGGSMLEEVPEAAVIEVFSTDGQCCALFAPMSTGRPLDEPVAG